MQDNQQYVLHFAEINQAKLPDAGGKGANLGELYNIPEINVPEGFCVTTAAFKQFVGSSSEYKTLLAELEQISPSDLDGYGRIGERLRRHLENLDIPEAMETAIESAWTRTGRHYAYAVRSSATAEDLPGASFAGQQDTFLNITGIQDILRHIRKCWASLFTDRAIVYRVQNGFRHNEVYLAVIVQRMVFPEVSGILFTADPVTGNRKITSIDASFGLGEALVSGMVTADLYKIKKGKLIHKNIAEKKLAIYALPEGGTVKQNVPPERRGKQALRDEAAILLAQMGQRIEQHFGCPQDIEWCLVDDEIFIVQSRPITTLYPVPHFTGDKLHLLLSFGHMQMMTEAMNPLGMSVLQTVVPVGKQGNPLAESSLLREAGNRLYVDVTPALEYKVGRNLIPAVVANADEHISAAVSEFISRPDFKQQQPNGRGLDTWFLRKAAPVAVRVIQNIVYRDHLNIIDRVNAFLAAKLQENKEQLQNTAGLVRIRKIQEILSKLLATVLINVGPYVAASVISLKIIERLSRRWLTNVEEELSSLGKSPSGNVTSEMGLALGDVADVVRQYPAVIEFLKQAKDDSFLIHLEELPGGSQVKRALSGFLAKYGMRGPGEIDITKPRWREVPSQLVPALLSHVDSMEPGHHRRSFAAGEQQAGQAAHSLVSRIRQTRWGFFKAWVMTRLIQTYRTLIALREHPKFYIVQNLAIIKKAILDEGQKLAAAGVLHHPEDVFWLTLPEIIAVLQNGNLDPNLIQQRQAQYLDNQKLLPPRAMTSEGEIISGMTPKADIPEGAIVGSPVSAGVVEGRARVVLRLQDAKLNKGDILVTPFTDPGWTPLFPLAGGLVTEAGGLMTHGAVVAREYGIPAVVGVDGATRKIKDGQIIRIDGRRGYIKIVR